MRPESKDAFGEMPEWSIGPHSKCGERVTVPRVRIPVSPQPGQPAAQAAGCICFPAASLLARRGETNTADGLRPSGCLSVASAPAASGKGMRSVSEHNPCLSAIPRRKRAYMGDVSTPIGLVVRSGGGERAYTGDVSTQIGLRRCSGDRAFSVKKAHLRAYFTIFVRKNQSRLWQRSK